MGRLSNRVERSEIEPGDHIYTYRAGFTFSHHGIYVGEGKVIHYTDLRKEYDEKFLKHSSSCPNIPNCGFHKPNSGVVFTCLDWFLGHRSLHRYKYGVKSVVLVAKVRGGTCTKATSDPPERVVHRANYLLQNGFGNYNLFRNNCEDFALYCKTELWILDWKWFGRSGQVSNAIVVSNVGLVGGLSGALVAFPVAAGVVGAPIFGIVGAYTTGMYLMSRYAVDIGVREDVLKVAVEDLPMNLGCGEMDDENTKKMRDLQEKITALKEKLPRFRGPPPPLRHDFSHDRPFFEPPLQHDFSHVRPFFEPPLRHDFSHDRPFFERR